MKVYVVTKTIYEDSYSGMENTIVVGVYKTEEDAKEIAESIRGKVNVSHFYPD